MAGLFDSLKASLSGVRASSKLIEVASKNIANASNEKYSRQKVELRSLGSNPSGRFFVGRGVEVSNVQRIHDELLETQLRKSHSEYESKTHSALLLSQLESLYQEPSDLGLKTQLSRFWQSWLDLASQPENLPTRAYTMETTETLMNTLHELDSQFDVFHESIPHKIEGVLREIDDIADQIVKINKEIFSLENSHAGIPHDLYDEREHHIRELSKKVGIDVRMEKNNTVSISIDGHPFIINDHREPLVFHPEKWAQASMPVSWQFGDDLPDDPGKIGGELGALLSFSLQTLPSHQEQLHTLTSTLIQEVNSLYVNGSGLQGVTKMESALGIDALNVSSITDPLSFISPGEKGEIQIAFYDAEGKTTRVSGIVVSEEDSLDAIREKLDAIRGLSASLLSSGSEKGRLVLEFDSSDATVGEQRFSLSRGEAGRDTSGFLDLLGFSSTEKSQNDSITAPELVSRDLTELQDILGEPDVSAVRSHALGLTGHFTLNLFEMATETAGLTDGSRVLQLRIDIERDDTIDSIISKVNDQMSDAVDGAITLAVDGSNRLRWTTTLQSNEKGNLLFPAGSGSHAVRLSFFDEYATEQHPADTPPPGYNGLGDNTGLFTALQINTLFVGDRADNIAFHPEIRFPEQLHVGNTTNAGDNRVAKSIGELQYRSLSINDRHLSLSTFYDESVTTLGAQVKRTKQQSETEKLILDNILEERNSLSGVSLDEELAKIIVYQRFYQGNGKMISIINELTADLLRAF